MAKGYVLVCSKAEHYHTAACQTPGKAKGEMRVTCGMKEHTHSISQCYKAVEK